jgi:hypothetical protein
MTFLLLPRPGTAVGAAARRFAFVIAGVLAIFLALTVALAGSHGAPLGRYTTAGAYSFVTEPSLHPPGIRRTDHASAGQLAPGYVFTANFYDLNSPPIVGQSGPLILDRGLQPVWFQPVSEKLVAANLSLQSYHGKAALAWWQGKVTNTGATESGEDVVVDQHYRTLARLRATGGWVLTLHELVIDGDHAWVTANKNIPMNLSKYGGAYNGALIDSAVQEYDLKTGKLLRNWDALEHIPLAESQASLPTNGFPWDAYHVNSVEMIGKQSFLVSMRDTWAAYLVDSESGKIQWTLGGRNSSFKFGKGAAFQWQHDVSLHGGSSVSLYDDHCCQLTGGGTYVNPTGPSRGLLLRLDQSSHTATLQAQYTRGQHFDAAYMGNAQPLANGNVFVGWGSEPYFSEYSRSGRLLFEGELPAANLTYRATLEPWVGIPLTPPLGAARTAEGKTTVYASWNGDTQVVSWRVLAGSAGGQMKALATAAKSSLETPIPVASGYARFEVQALDAHGKVLATTRPFTALSA